MELLNIPKYRIVSHYSREKFIHGGTCIFVREDLDGFLELSVINKMSVEKEIEASCVLSKTRKLIILSVYRTCLDNIQVFVNKLDQMLFEIEKDYSGHKVLICGDFNINLMEDTETKRNFLDLLNIYGFNPTINEPTRITRTSETLIDTNTLLTLMSIKITLI